MHKNKYSQYKTEEVRHHHAVLLERKKLMQRKAKVIGTPSHKVILEELAKDLETLRRSYAKIDLSGHTNTTTIKLAKLVGKEEELARQIENWRTPAENATELDTELGLCEELLRERKAI